MQVDYSLNDLNELDRLELLIERIDHIIAAEAELMMDEMCLQQPFFLSVLLGYRFERILSRCETVQLLLNYLFGKKSVANKSF
jgi:hypothetical protein